MQHSYLLPFIKKVKLNYKISHGNISFANIDADCRAAVAVSKFSRDTINHEMLGRGLKIIGVDKERSDRTDIPQRGHPLMMSTLRGMCCYVNKVRKAGK